MIHLLEIFSMMDSLNFIVAVMIRSSRFGTFEENNLNWSNLLEVCKESEVLTENLLSLTLESVSLLVEDSLTNIKLEFGI